MALIETLEPVSKTLQSAATATGNGQIFELNGKFGALTLQVVIATTATVTFEASQDGTNFIAIRGINKNSGTGATTATASGIFTFAVTGIKKFRARISSWGAGAVTVTATAVPASEPANSATPSGTVAIDQTTQGTTNGVQLLGSITPAHTAVNVTTSTGAVLAANANRKYALLINDSDATIYLKIGANAVLNQGIRLNANGGSYEMSTANGNLATGAINGIHGSTGNKAILVTEGV